MKYLESCAGLQDGFEQNFPPLQNFKLPVQKTGAVDVSLAKVRS